MKIVTVIAAAFAVLATSVVVIAVKPEPERVGVTVLVRLADHAPAGLMEEFEPMKLELSPEDIEYIERLNE